MSKKDNYAIIAVIAALKISIPGDLSYIVSAILYGLIIGGIVITFIRIISLVGKEWLSPIIAALLVLPLILAQFKW